MRSITDIRCTRTRQRNKSKSRLIRILSHYFYSLETKLYNEKHTKTILDAERNVVNKKLADVKNGNQ